MAGVGWVGDEHVVEPQDQHVVEAQELFEVPEVVVAAVVGRVLWQRQQRRRQQRLLLQQLPMLLTASPFKDQLLTPPLPPQGRVQLHLVVEGLPQLGIAGGLVLV